MDIDRAAALSGGLSPYTRGNRRECGKAGVLEGSIPVHTGKPAFFAPSVAIARVYPRTHGETSAMPSLCASQRGLSPYTRGNHLDADRHGQPRNGLSPYTRGNLARRRHLFGLRGSIPVHTGKPRRAPRSTDFSEVYPRTHGETQRTRQPKINGKGLSPYTRGNLARFQCRYR